MGGRGGERERQEVEKFDGRVQGGVWIDRGGGKIRGRAGGVKRGVIRLQCALAPSGRGRQISVECLSEHIHLQEDEVTLRNRAVASCLALSAKQKQGL